MMESSANEQPTEHSPAFEPLSLRLHSGWKLAGGDYRFLTHNYLAPLLLEEFADAARHYPVLFTGEQAVPIALFGVERRNLFVEGNQWSQDVYIPAHVRRHPFGVVKTQEPEGFALAIDTASEWISRDGSRGEALFVDGAPSELTRRALQFCEVWQREATRTLAFSSALMAQNLLIERRADVSLPDGRALSVDGFRIVDRDRLAKLDAPIIVTWQRQGWLAAVHAHLASLERFEQLLIRRQRQGGI